MSNTPRRLLSLTLENITYPVILRGFISKWEPSNWKLEDWVAKFGEKKLPFRVGCLNESEQIEPTWERNCSTEFMTMKEFLEWNFENDVQVGQKWMYFDYKYMHEWFENDLEFLKEFDWSCLGFDGRDGRESTLWIGSNGAHTPCHSDSYGFNLVAQLIGRKRWLLYPPDSKPLLNRASRIPYEESSVYVSGSFGGGQGGARGVVLSPGEVLLVPRHWWHRVNVEGGIAISVNSWLPSVHDKESRLEEALVRFLFASTIKNLPSTWQKILLNPNEDDLANSSFFENLEFLKQSIVALNSPYQHDGKNQPLTNLNEGTSDQRPMKRRKISTQTTDRNEKTSVHIVPLVGRDGWPSWNLSQTYDGSPNVELNVLRRTLNAFCHPEVISLVRHKMLLGGDENDTCSENSSQKIPP